MAMHHQSTASLVIRVFGHLSARRKRQLGVLAIFMVISSFIEALSIGSILPFLAALTAPTEIQKIKFIGSMLDWYGISGLENIRLFFSFIFIGLIVSSGLLRISFFLFQTRLSMYIGVDFSVDAYAKTLHQPYEVLISRNSSEILAGAQKSKDLVGWVVQPTLILISSVFMLSAVLATLFFIEPKVALFGILGFGFLYGVATVLSRQFLKHNSLTYSVEMVLANKAIQEGMGGIRDIIIDGTQKIFINLYEGAVGRMQMAAAGNVVLSQLPRYCIEIFGMCLLTVLALVLSEQDGGVVTAIPTLGVIALGIQRLLPVLQQAYSAYASIRGGVNSSLDALALLDQNPSYISDASESENIIFKNVLSLKDVKFRYDSSPKFILDGVNIEIPRGSRVGVIGASGSGKSTLVDLVMGLLNPTFGKVLVDGCALEGRNMKSWQSCISHVPQHIFLADTTIAENIAFGVSKDELDWDRVRDAAKIAQISEVIELLPNGYLTNIGERGVKLSGGQRQRIGIARAVYKRSRLLILDEATSALDGEIEGSVINAISTLGEGVTMLLVAHRISTLRYCDFIVEIKKGRIVWSGSYLELEDRPSS